VNHKKGKLILMLLMKQVTANNIFILVFIYY